MEAKLAQVERWDRESGKKVLLFGRVFIAMEDIKEDDVLPSCNGEVSAIE